MDDTILFDNAITYKSLLESMYKCKRGVIWKDSVARFIQNSPIEITKLHDELINMTYRMGNPVIFKVYEPKERIIQSLKFRDKVFQKSLCDNVLIPILKNKFIYDNGASLKGKGYSFSLDRLRVHLQKYYNDTKTNKGWVLKCDIHHYFDSMVHEIILNKLSKYFFDERFLFYIEDSLNIYGENGVGIGLGSQINQTIALLYLNDLDHFIKEQLYIKYYGRYMDDFYLIHEDKEYLKYCKNEIKDFIKKDKLLLSEKKTQIFPISNGIKFIGFTRYLTETGGTYLRLDRKNISNERRKLRAMHNLYTNGIISLEDICLSFSSWQAHAKRCNNRKLVISMQDYFLNLFFPMIEDYSRKNMYKINKKAYKYRTTID